MPEASVLEDAPWHHQVLATHIGEWSMNVRMRNKQHVAEMERWKYGSMEG